MRFAPFGNTGVNVSALGFGAMRLPMKKGHVVEELSFDMIRRAYAAGINYFDTGSIYCNGESEKTLGAAVKGMDRSKIYLSTKYPADKPSYDELMQKFESSLRIMDESYIDFYHLWGIGLKSFREQLEPGPLRAALRLKDEGLIKHLSFSFHSDPSDLIPLIDTGYFETVLCQYNLLDRRNEAGMRHAASKGVGVAIMGPIGGGRLGGPSRVFREMLGKTPVSTPELALRFVLANPSVTMALSGMSTMQQLEENLKTASSPVLLDDAEKVRVEVALQENQKLADLYCTGCKYCLPCPHDVNIPYVFELVNYHRVFDIPGAALSGYRELTEGVPWLQGKNASFCETCGECESKCPQKIEIVEKLKEAHALLSRKYASKSA
jgi:predicted aldo/keto reductase-like oxidoreductase